MQTALSFEGEAVHEPRGILQVHPTLRCNLLCRHCYSNSGPAAGLHLENEVLLDAVEDAASLGYEVLSVSGGEPFLYEGLTALLERAKDLGMFTQITTNGTLLTEERCRAMRENLDLMAVSLDGPSELHNEIRGSDHAFDRLADGLGVAKLVGLPFGIIHTLTRRSWPHLLWIAEFADRQGASLLQIHPLEHVGRAASHMLQDSLGEDDLLRSYLISLALSAKYEGAMAIQFDAVERAEFLRNTEWAYVSPWGIPQTLAAGPDSVRILVVEADGAVVPLSYGMSREFEICDLKRENLKAAWPLFMHHRYGRLRKLCREVYDEVVLRADLAILNWHEMLVAKSHEVNSESYRAQGRRKRELVEGPAAKVVMLPPLAFGGERAVHVESKSRGLAG